MLQGDDSAGLQQPLSLPVVEAMVGAEPWRGAARQQHCRSHAAKVLTAARREVADNATVNTRHMMTAKGLGRVCHRMGFMAATIIEIPQCVNQKSLWHHFDEATRYRKAGWHVIWGNAIVEAVASVCVGCS
jgi:hypothetical protein